MTAIASEPGSTYLTAESTIASWLLTKDHKRIALLFFASVTAFFSSEGSPRRSFA